LAADRRAWFVAGALGTTQLIAWASSYYLPAILAPDMAASVHVPATWIFGAFSLAMLVSAALGPWVGRAIDRRGGKPVLLASNALFIGGLLALAFAPNFAVLCLAWLVLGVAMSFGLYDSAFAALAGIYGRDARGAITGVTLVAGFASTVGWPLTAIVAHAYDWRAACLMWIAIHLVIAVPLNAGLPSSRAPHIAAEHTDGASEAPRFAMALLAFVFAATWFVTGSMSAHLPALLEACGAAPAAAILASALVGPAQVAARIAEWTLLRRSHPMISARIATIAHPIGVGILALAGPAGIFVFTILYGIGNGILTIAKGTLPLAVFGPAGYGERQGWLSAPARIVQAAAPFAFGLVLDGSGPRAALVLSSGLCLAALVALLLLRPVPRREPLSLSA
jgi:predicted MFS family arabinose efflux permease